MDFFSGLKKAYDSLGEEISKTFDSSQSNEDVKATTSPLKAQGDLSSTPVVAKAAPKSRSPEPRDSAGNQSSLYATPPTGAGQRGGQGSSDDGGWGQWENQPLMAAKTKVGGCFCMAGLLHFFSDYIKGQLHINQVAIHVRISDAVPKTDAGRGWKTL